MDISSLTQMFYIQFWQFNMLPERNNSCENPNIEIRNPKQYQNPNVQNSKQTKAVQPCVFMFWSLIFLSFEFVSNFDIRISDFPVSDKCIKYNHFGDVSSCQSRMLNL